MPDAQTTASALSAAITFKVQREVLANLRADLVFANEQYAAQGDFDEGKDTLMWVDVPDLAINTTPLTEGSRPEKKALSMGTVTASTTQYGDLVSITDVAKVKSPIEIVPIASERLSRQSRESIDQITRDAIAAGGTPFYAGTGNTDRAGVAAGDVVAMATLRTLRATMYLNKIPMFPDETYQLWVSPNVGLDIRSDSNFIDAVKYQFAGKLLRGEIGTIAGFKVIEVVNAPTFSSTTTVHASLALGAQKGWGAGELQSLQTYHVAPGGDHTDPLAQEELVGWKVMFGVAVLDNDFYYRLESGATAL
jgi:N4-gp56 family major capsid protein